MGVGNHSQGVGESLQRLQRRLEPIYRPNMGIPAAAQAMHEFGTHMHICTHTLKTGQCTHASGLERELDKRTHKSG